SLKTSIKTITYLSDIGCLEIQGASLLPFNKVRWVALVGGDKESFVQMGWEKNISDYLKNMCSYLGIEDADVTFLCNTVVFDGEELHASYYQSLLSQVRDMVDAL
ncbi:TPA: hypothetical protein ACGRXH_001836, partial [Escherichia coli]